MLIRIIAVAMILVGLSGFFMSEWIGRATAAMGQFELPLVDVHDVAIARDGRLYFALGSAERVQIYSSAGAFLRNFEVDSAGGVFCLALTDERLAVFLVRGHTVDEFDLDGRPAAKFAVDGRPLGTTAPGHEQFEAPCERDPRVARIDYALDRVAVTLADSVRPLTIARCWWHYLLPGSFLSWFIYGIGFVLWLAILTFRTRRDGDRPWG